MSKNSVTVLISHRHRLLDLNYCILTHKNFASIFATYERNNFSTRSIHASILNFNVPFCQILQKQPMQHNGKSHCLHLQDVLISCADSDIFPLHAQCIQFCMDCNFFLVSKTILETVPIDKPLPFCLYASRQGSFVQLLQEVSCLFLWALHNGSLVMLLRKKHLTLHRFIKIMRNTHLLLCERSSNTIAFLLLVTQIHYLNLHK